MGAYYFAEDAPPNFLDKRLDGLDALLKSCDSRTTVLDVGCAEGLIAKEFHDRDAKVLGIEIDTEMAQRAGELLPEVWCGNAFDVLDYLDKQLEIVLCLGVLHKPNIPDVIEMVGKLRRVTGTYLAIRTTPDVFAIIDELPCRWIVWKESPSVEGSPLKIYVRS